MRKLTDEEWQKVMDQTQGHKVGRAIYEAGYKLRPTNKSGKFWSPWDELNQNDKQFFIDIAGELFDNEVIEGGNALPKLYNQARDQES